jgi:hypothetical protein
MPGAFLLLVHPLFIANLHCPIADLYNHIPFITDLHSPTPFITYLHSPTPLSQIYIVTTRPSQIYIVLPRSSHLHCPNPFITDLPSPGHICFLFIPQLFCIFAVQQFSHSSSICPFFYGNFFMCHFD